MLRLDQLLLSQGLARSRTRAQRLIRHGRVSLMEDGRVLCKPGEKLAETTELCVEDDPEERYVSRAGLKLEAVLEALALRLEGQCVLDIGQSTGGFTDCALHYGAARVVGIEVGHGQLDERLRGDSRVECLEGINARYLSQSERVITALQAQPPSIVVMDVSFISQTLILAEIASVLEFGGQLVSLVKPQFELGPDAVDTRGLVRDASRYPEVQQRIQTACEMCGFEVLHWQESPITGSDGNREFLLHACLR
ncbi:TlyA family rRNA (cytidine-2'-O)-methyltransferase [Halomonas sp. ZH2S]|uniref:TlyA family rRNA (Cytidine-2'-O)-methyltransferase n=1 Tax=Vreelandella zhuhanensis TaxID=2684210 RepID=A0A7X3GZG2_9GAMM|nr:TlyA family RNA methyltransferase [Halomonas zhuhanensis]MWJ27725.1 TlyA family rRNA (cytidine-2'-O)-methyltransferase [Halomonas zhuhanensis]